MHDDALAGRAAEPSAADCEQAPSRPRGRWRALVSETFTLLAMALVTALVIKTFVVQPFFIPSGSMEDTLLIGDKILVNKLVYRLRPIQPGDIVVFRGTGSWNPPAASPAHRRSSPAMLFDAVTGWIARAAEGLAGAVPGQVDYIKRVIGVPGDRVACCNARGQITVNGVALREQSYLYPGARPSQDPFSIVVPPGRLWVLGDNRSDSEDSRMHDCAYALADQCRPWDPDGTIPESAVVGRAFMIVWPPSRVRILPIPATFGNPRLAGAAARPASQQGPASATGPGAVPAEPGMAATAAPLQVRPAAPALPLACGFAVAAPLSVLSRRLRRRRILRFPRLPARR